MARYDDECRGGFQTRPVAGATRTGATLAGTFKRFLGACLLLALCGCSPEYFVRAAYEEGRILWRRKPITTVLAEDGVAPDVRRKLEMVLELRDFAADELRLNVGGSYAAYSYIDRPVLLHVLTAVPKTSFEPYTWWFPFVGHVPYKGYFDRSDANKEADALAAQGHDTNIRPAGAFSTLGWFDDPVARAPVEARPGAARGRCASRTASHHAVRARLRGLQRKPGQLRRQAGRHRVLCPAPRCAKP